MPYSTSTRRYGRYSIHTVGTTCEEHFFCGQLRSDDASGGLADSAAEVARFMAVARAHGVGDRWGEFSSWVGRRVGYQCSGFYREVAVGRGLVVDPRFRFTRSGAVVFVG